MIYEKYIDKYFDSIIRRDDDTPAVSRFLVDAHKAAHEQVRKSFKEELERAGYEVRESSSFETNPKTELNSVFSFINEAVRYLSLRNKI